MLAVLLVVLLVGLAYWLYVREQLQQVHERHLRLLGNAADKLELVIAITQQNGDNLISDLTTLPTFLRQNPHVKLRDRRDPAVLARSLTDPQKTAKTIFRSQAPHLEMQIVDLVEAGREARVARDRPAEQVLGRLEKTENTSRELVAETPAGDGSPDGAPPAGIYLRDIVEVLEVDIPLQAGDLPLEPGKLTAEEIDVSGQPALLVKPTGGGADRGPGRLVRRHFVLSTAATKPGELALAGGLRVGFDEARADEPNAVLSAGRLRVVGARRVLRSGLELAPAQADRLGSGGLGLQAEDEGSCGVWTFQDGRPLERIGEPRPQDVRAWSRLPARREGRLLYVEGWSRPHRLGYFQRSRIPEEGLHVGFYCPPELRAGGVALPMTLEQQREVELLLRRLAQARRETRSYAEDLSAVEVARVGETGRRAARLELTASYRADPIELELPSQARDLLEPGTGATLLHLDKGPSRATASFLLSVTKQEPGETEEPEIVRLPIAAEERQRMLLERILGDATASLELVRTDAERGRSYRLRADARRPVERLPLEMVDGGEATEDLRLPAGETLGTGFGPGWRIRLGGNVGAPPAERPALTFKFDLESVLASNRLDAAFTSYLLVDETGEVVFQRFPEAMARLRGAERVRHRSGLRFRALADRSAGGSAPADTKTTGSEAAAKKPAPKVAPRTTSTEDIRQAGLDLRLVCQPTRLRLQGGNKVWRLCGQVDPRRAITEAMGSAPYLTFGLSAVVILGLLSIPFLRFLLMRRNERLQRGAVLMLLAGTWLTLVIVSMFPAAWGRHAVLETVMEGQLRQLATRVRTGLAANLEDARALLDELDVMAAAAFRGGEAGENGALPGCDWLDRDPQSVAQQVRLLDEPASPQVGLYVDRLRQKGLLRPFTSVFWLDGQGDQIAKATVAPENTPAINVAERSYFRAVAEDRPWTASMLGSSAATAPERPWLFFDTFLSITTGERSAALSMPSRLPLADCGAAGRPVAVLTGLPPAVARPVVSDPLGFAVIDAAGRTLMHSRPGHALTSNFLEEVGEPDRLVSVLVSRTARQFDGDYQSRPHSFYVAPLHAASSLPGERPGWWIVAFYDKELPRTVVSEALLFGLVPTAATGLLLGLLLVIFRQRVLRGLWPSRGETDRYLFLGAVYLLVAMVQAAALLSPSLTDDPTYLLLLYIVGPLAVVLGSSMLLHRERAAATRGRGEAVGEPAEEAAAESRAVPADRGFMARAGARIRTIIDRLAAWLTSGFLRRAGAWIAAAGLRLSYWPRRTWLGLGEIGRTSVFSERDSLAYVAGMILLWIILAVLPALAFFSSAWSRQLNALLQHDTLVTLEGLAERRQELRADLERLDLDPVANLDERLRERDGLYLFSAAAELLRERRKRDLFQGWLPEPVAGAQAIGAPMAWIFRALSDRLPVYNRATQSLRNLGAARLPGFVMSDDALQLSLPETGRSLVGNGDDFVSMVTSGVAGKRRTQLFLPAVLVLLLIMGLAVWVWYTANHICFSRVRPESPETAAAVIRAIRAAAAAGEAEPDGSRRAAGFLVVVTAREHYEALQALGEGIDLCEASPASSAESAPARERRIVICKRLESDIDDQEKRRHKLATLRRLLKSPVDLPVVLCPRNPWEILRPAMPGGSGDEPAAAASFELDEDEAAIWSGVLRRLELHHVGVPVLQRPDGEGPREEEYWVIWSNCSARERLAMIQLAAESVLNPKQADAVASLARRGILELEPMLEFADAGFRDFVARFKHSSHFREVERQARSAGWGGRRWIFATVVVLAAAFLFLTKPQLFNATLAVLGAIAAAIPAFLSLLGRSGGAAGQGAGG